MRATGVLQKCLGDSLDAIHAQRTRVLMRAVEATIAGRRLTLIELAFRDLKSHRYGQGFETASPARARVSKCCCC